MLDYYDRQGVGPLWDVVQAMSTSGITPYILPVLYFVAVLWGSYKMFLSIPNCRYFLLLLLPAFFLSVGYFSPILLSLPFILIAALYLDTHPKVSAAVVSLGSVLMIHPLLGYFLIFFTDRKREFGVTALVATLFFTLLPLVIFSPKELLSSYYEWISGFRGVPPDTQSLPQKFSFIHIMRVYEVLPAWVMRLFIINLFHVQLLPCLKVRHLSSPAPIFPLFVSSLLLFIGLFSSMNTPYTLLISLVGVLGWVQYSRLKRGWSKAIGLTVVIISYLCLGLIGLGYISMNIAEIAVTLPLFAVWIICMVEIWRHMYKYKVKKV
ncbi:hypothetical protein [Porphyromonas sp.]|uniref:hypothetical protein n=1 Tax=Porphyromonas sp. TaxID=1924944 RepID=UPI0026DCE5B2|nr:hypothetical protein [Porphyromonas sp.]MDO4695502.1 hypothetical protein [Porphyromonas sp.]MDO4770257.1 hypothetical protein [Porphyromonas sp.]